MPKITVEYNGEYPNLCSGKLFVTIDEKRWEFPDYCLYSGGSVYFDGEWNGCIENGVWSISKWPEGFPEDMEDDVVYAVNRDIRHGCCGGCL